MKNNVLMWAVYQDKLTSHILLFWREKHKCAAFTAATV